MFDLARQVQVAADNTKNGSAGRAGVEPRRYEDNLTTIDQLKGATVRHVLWRSDGGRIYRRTRNICQAFKFDASQVRFPD